MPIVHRDRARYDALLRESESTADTYYTTGYAEFYDRYFTHWTRNFAPRLVESLTEVAPETTLLDLCCGTGAATTVFCSAGWTVTGVDLSTSMLAIAHRRLQGAIDSGTVRLLNASAANFTVPGPVGACISLEGALNHLESRDQLVRCFERVRASLVPGGRFVFDLYDPEHFRHWNHITVFDEPDAVVVKRGVWSGDRGSIRYSGAVAASDGLIRIDQNLQSFTFERDVVHEALELAQLEPVDCDLEMPPCGCSRPDRAASCHTLYAAVRV